MLPTIKNTPINNRCVIKWVRVHKSKLNEVTQRLHFILTQCPSGTPKLLNFGFAPTLSSSDHETIRLQFQQIEGQNLIHLLSTLNAPMITHFKNLIVSQQKAWQRESFIHGDLSLRNILICTQNQVWFVDWLLDLKSFKGTPQYSSKHVYRGYRNQDSEDYAFKKILKNMSPVRFIY